MLSLLETPQRGLTEKLSRFVTRQKPSSVLRYKRKHRLPLHAHVTVFPALAGSPPSRIIDAEALYGVFVGLMQRLGRRGMGPLLCAEKSEIDVPQYRQDRNYENLNKVIFTGTGAFDVPVLHPVRCDTRNWLSFNYAKTCDEPEGHGVHFFIDDYQFQRVWARPDTYVPMLSRFDAVTTPDFSTYTDFPKAIQIYNHYRKHWLGAYWQWHGLMVVPTISWSDEESLNWCFDGEPVGGTVAVSAVGTQMDRRSRELFSIGYRAMLERLKPESIVFYGTVPDEFNDDNIIPVAAYQDVMKERCKHKQENTEGM